jgi:hypothetical protein
MVYWPGPSTLPTGTALPAMASNHVGSTPEARFRRLAEQWSGVPPRERSNYQLFIGQLCAALGVEGPRPAGSGYEFEHPVRVVNRDGTESVNFVDLYKRGCFVLEAKDQGADQPESVTLRGAFGQAKTYAADVEGGPPPYLLVLDVGRTLIVWDRWSGSYRGFNAGRRIPLATLADRPDDIALLRDIWENPAARDPHVRAAAVTRDIAEKLAQLASSLEQRGHGQEQVARFLIRCVFTMFAEDVGLLPSAPFTAAVEEIGFADPEEFATVLAELWAAMDTGGRFGLRKFLRFNGHFFADQTVLPLTRDDMAVLHQAAMADWAEVEPAIMGTLLTRALDPEERHRLGAEYTPRQFVERIVRPTVEEPIRERWTAVQAEVLQLRNSSAKSERVRREKLELALDRLRGFHEWLRGLRFLDPACGSGNFLYVTLDLVKQIELEVLRAIEEITGHPELAVEEVGPWQFHGIEVKAWARELAELTLWIGYHQWWRRAHGHAQPPEPVLRDTKTLEHRDAVLEWESVREDPDRSRPDPEPRILHPVTGQLVPDPAATIGYHVYEGTRPAAWPRADFIIGNPPYMGDTRMRSAFGDGYVDALRAAYPEVPAGADYVMYWWHRAAQEVASERSTRAGLITTNTITQRRNRRVIEAAGGAGAHVGWAIPNHPWVNETGAADVRVAMSIIERKPRRARQVLVDDQAKVISTKECERLNADFSAAVDIAGTSKHQLLANSDVASMGFALYGSGFILDQQEALSLRRADPRYIEIIRPYLNGRDIAAHSRRVYVIDFGLMDEDSARSYPVAYDIVRNRVKPHREANKRASIRDTWWQFGWPRPVLRSALNGLSRYIVTIETSKHRYFIFLSAEIAPDNKLVCIASDDAFHLGVLNSRIHTDWALAAGGRLGVGNDPVYTKSTCFNPFPFPDPTLGLRGRVASVAEQLDRHRSEALGRHESVTLTGMYNVMEKLRTGETLTTTERRIHDAAACGVLRDLHDELDWLVANAYGWEWPLERETILTQLVELHGARRAEETAGVVRWLRPEYQQPRLATVAKRIASEITEDTSTATATIDGIIPWPDSTIEQIRSLQSLLARGAHTVEEATRIFSGARKDIVARHLETLAIMGEARLGPDGAYIGVRQAA